MSYIYNQQHPGRRTDFLRPNLSWKESSILLNRNNCIKPSIWMSETCIKTTFKEKGVGEREKKKKSPLNRQSRPSLFQNSDNWNTVTSWNTLRLIQSPPPTRQRVNWINFSGLLWMKPLACNHLIFGLVSYRPIAAYALTS